MLLIPKLAPEAGTQLAQGADLSKVKNLPADAARAANLWQLYAWGERESVEEQLITHTPARWLPSAYPTWDDFLAAVVQRGLRSAHAPLDLAAWQQGSAFPLDIEHPLFSYATLLARLLLGVPTGTGPQSQSGDITTVRQVRPGLRPLRAIHRRPRRPRPRHPQPCPRPVRQPRQPVLHGPAPVLAARQHLPPPVHPRRHPAHHRPHPHPHPALTPSPPSFVLVVILSASFEREGPDEARITITVILAEYTCSHGICL